MAITTQMRTDVANLYVSLFGRAPERDGLAFWVGQLDAGKTVAQVAQSMFDTAPAQAVYPSFLTNSEIVAKFYSNVLGRTADAEGLAFWTAKLNAGQSKGSLIQDMISAVQSYAGTDTAAVASKALLANKVAAGLYYAVDLGGNDVNAASAILSTITSATSSVDAVKAGTTTGTVGQTFTLTTGVDALTGSGSNDTYLAVIDNAGATTTTAGTKTTLNLGDTIDGALGTDTLNIVTNLTGGTSITGATFKNIEVVNVNNVATATADTVTINAAVAPQATQFNATGNGSLTVTNIGTAAIGVNGVAANTGVAQTITAAGANTVNIQGATVSTTVAGSALNIDVSAGTSTSAQAVVVNSNGTTANTVSNIKIGNATVGASSLTVNAAANLKATLTENIANTLKTVTISGAATTVDLGTLPSNALTSVDASGLTAGGAKVGIGTNTATTFKGGAGNDTLTIAAGVVMTGASDGGAGTNTLAVSDTLLAGATGNVVDTSLTTATGKLFTNFQTLQVSGAIGAATDAATLYAQFDPTLGSGFTSYNVAASTVGVKLINLGASPTVNLVGNETGLAGVALVLKDATGTSDVVNVTINNGNTLTTGNISGLSTTKLTAAGVETINVASKGSILGTGTANTISSLDLDTNTALSKVVLTGDQKLAVTTGTQTTAKDLSIDGSAMTASLTVDATGVKGKVNINGGSANDTITLTNTFTKGGLIYGGAGGDAVDLGATNAGATLVFKAGTDSLLDTLTATTTKMDSISNFITTKDTIDLTAFAFTATQKGAIVYDTTTYANLAAVVTAATANASTWFNDATATARGIRVVTDGTNDYVFVDANKDGTFNASTDLAIKLLGLTTADATKVALADFLV